MNRRIISWLKCLSLSNIIISALDLNLLLAACLKLEKLALINPEIVMSDTQTAMEVSISSLKDIFGGNLSLEKFTLEADTLEILHLRECAIDIFELIGKASLVDRRF